MYKIIIFGLGILLIFAGLQFRMMHWPYAKLVYFSGQILSIVALLVFIVQRMKQKSKSSRHL